MEVHVNAAMSADGKLSTRAREQVDISGPEDFERVDRLRADSDAVMVGVGTVLADDPSLTIDEGDRIATRRDRGEPARVVADSRGRTPSDARVLNDEAPTYVLLAEAAPASDRQRLAAEATTIVAGEDRVDLSAALAALGDRGIEQLMVEGGGEVLFSLFAAGLVDRLSVFVGPMVIGGRDAPTLADGEGFRSTFPALELRSVDRLDEGVLLQWDIV